MDAADLAKLRKSSVSMASCSKARPSGWASAAVPTYGAPDKVPARGSPRSSSGQAKVPFTSGILIGIGETREERIEALLALRDLHRALATCRNHHPELQSQARHAHGQCTGPSSTSCCGPSPSRA